MTKKEVIKLLSLIETVYSYCITKDETVIRWFIFCTDMNYDIVMARLREHIRKSPYPPAMADLAVLTEEENKFPKWVERCMEEVKEQQKSIPAWMYEYSPRKTTSL